MDGATLQNKIYGGYAKAAKRIGRNTDVYRPTDSTAAIVSANKVETIPASFNAEDMKYGKPNKYGHPTWYVLLDGRLTQVGDYLDNAYDGTYFIAAQQTGLPILCVQCNRVVSALRPQIQSGLGAQGYGGNTDSKEAPLITSWPASILQGIKGERSEVGLPGDNRTPWWSILMPYLAGAVLRTGDIIKDDLHRRYIISSAELTDLGWRITAKQALT